MTSPRNKEPWSSEEIELLDQFLQSDLPFHRIAHGMGRTEMAVHHATSKMIFQQLLEHTPEEIAERYNKPLSWIQDELIDAKYRVEFDHEIASHTHQLFHGILSVAFATVVSGMVYWVHLLNHNNFGRAV